MIIDITLQVRVSIPEDQVPEVMRDLGITDRESFGKISAERFREQLQDGFESDPDCPDGAIEMKLLDVKVED